MILYDCSDHQGNIANTFSGGLSQSKLWSPITADGSMIMIAHLKAIFHFNVVEGGIVARTRVGLAASAVLQIPSNQGVSLTTRLKPFTEGPMRIKFTRLF